MLSTRTLTAYSVKGWGIRQFLFTLSGMPCLDATLQVTTKHHIGHGWRATISKGATPEHEDRPSPFFSVHRTNTLEARNGNVLGASPIAFYLPENYSMDRFGSTILSYPYITMPSKSPQSLSDRGLYDKP